MADEVSRILGCAGELLREYYSRAHCTFVAITCEGDEVRVEQKVGRRPTESGPLPSVNLSGKTVAQLVLNLCHAGSGAAYSSNSGDGTRRATQVKQGVLSFVRDQDSGAPQVESDELGVERTKIRESLSGVIDGFSRSGRWLSISLQGRSVKVSIPDGVELLSVRIGIIRNLRVRRIVALGGRVEKVQYTCEQADLEAALSTVGREIDRQQTEH